MANMEAVVVVLGFVVMCVVLIGGFGWLLGRAVISRHPYRNVFLVFLSIIGVYIANAFLTGRISVNWSVLFG